MAKYKKIKCPRCKRRFSMAAHLARHMSTLHKRKTKKRVAKKSRRKAKRKVGRPKGSVKKKLGRPKGRGVATRQSMREGSARLLSGMRNYQSKLIDVRNRLEAEISALSKAMNALRG